MNKILGFIDLLGFSSMVENNPEEARKVLNDFYNIAFDIIKQDTSVEGSLFSDSLLAHSTSYSSLINCITQIYRECLKRNKYYLDNSNFFLLPRGAISVGLVNIETRDTSPNLTKDFIVSPALVHSAKLEQAIKGSRLLIAVKNDDPHQVTNIQWNDNINNTLYENSSFIFWKDYKYQDALWFSDLSKNHDDQKAELIELIDISISLAKRNIKSKSLDQHINTLRIGLLSYSKFLGSEEDIIINRIIQEFKNEKYWLIWLTLIEMIVNSSYTWKYAISTKIKNFYKKSSLHPSWANIINEINKPGHTYLKGSVKEFLNEMF